MKINNNSFELNDKLLLIIDSSDNDTPDAKGSCAEIRSKFEEKQPTKVYQNAPPPPQRKFAQQTKRYIIFPLP